METVFIRFLNMGISAGWLILVILLLRVVLQKAPKNVNCILWALAGARLICPFSIESMWSLLPDTEAIRPDIVYPNASPAIGKEVLALNPAVNPLASPEDVGESAGLIPSLLLIGTVIWITGMAFMILYELSRYCALKRKLCEGIAWKENIRLCDRIGTPFILGIFRPQIYLPSSMEQWQIPYVISHEKAHLSRRDHWWKPLGFAILTVHWFNPLVWVAYRFLCRDIELACDEKVIKDFSISEKKAYSMALLACSAGGHKTGDYLLAFGETGVKERVMRVMTYKKPVKWIVFVAAIICGIVSVCFLTEPKRKAEPSIVSASVDSSITQDKENITEADLSGLFYERFYPGMSYEDIEAKLMERNVYHRSSKYYDEMSRYWEEARGVTDISYRMEPLYYTDMKYYSKKDFQDDPDIVIYIAANEIYAKHGYVFGDKDLNNYFMECAWYQPAEDGKEADNITLNDYEAKNLELLRSLQQIK